MKKCSRCLENKPKSEFHKHAARKDGLDTYCRQCNNQRSKEYYVKNKERHNKTAAAWRENNPDKLKEYAERERARIYGITIEDYNKLLEDQDYACAICGGDNNGKALVVDHDHSCCPGKGSCGECVRELLCNHCNWMLGNAKDDPEILEAGKKYLGRHSRPKNLAKNLD